MTLPNLPKALWISDDASLADACTEWALSPYLILDTEFVRTTTFYPKPGLIQLATESNCWLIDPLSITTWQPFADLMLDLNVVKVFHACAEDLEVCRRLFDVVPEPLFDTQLGLAYAGMGGSMGFQRAVSTLLNIEIPKEATRSDWLQTPLTDQQVNYALADVFYLRQLYPLICSKLEALGRMSWLMEDCDRISKAARPADDDLKNSYWRVKLAWKLRPQEQYILQQLSVWRELRARELDVPRNKVADDSTLWNLARYKARNRDQLQKAGLHAAVIRDCGKEILKMIADAQLVENHLWPELLLPPLSVSDGNRLKKLRIIVRERAEELNIPPEVLANKRILEALIRSEGRGDLPEAVTGWRMEVIGESIINWLSNNNE